MLSLSALGAGFSPTKNNSLHANLAPSLTLLSRESSATLVGEGGGDGIYLLECAGCLDGESLTSLACLVLLGETALPLAPIFP